MSKSTPTESGPEHRRVGLLLVVGADAQRWRLAQSALSAEYTLAFAVDMQGTLDLLTHQRAVAVVLASELLDRSRAECLAMLRKHAGGAELPIVVLPGHDGDVDVVDARDLTAVLGDDWRDRIRATLRELLAPCRAQEPGAEPQLRRLPAYREMVLGTSPAIRKAIEMVRRVAGTNVNVLLSGETGTGKELFARRLHALSARARGPFRAVNLPAVPHELFESVLFGHERGAFTGAIAQNTGAFAQADEGTLFLDEIASLNLAVQPKLLRVIQEGEVERVGGRGPKQCDVRVVTAANLDLVEAVRRHEFREDLYHRLSVVTIEIPPLRQRIEDIPPLVKFFVDKYATKFGRQVPEVSSEAMAALQREPWTGNVRELENCVQRALVLASGSRLELGDLELSRPERSASKIHFASCDYCLEDVEQAYIQRVLEHTDGNQSQAARILGIDRKTLRAKRQRFDSEDRHELQSVS